MRKKGPEYSYQNRSLKNLQGEQWQDVPGFEGEYEISSLGRIKSLRRWRGSGTGGYYTTEKIRKQFFRISKNRLLGQFSYTVTSSLKRNGKSISRSTSRYVYYAFVTPFDLDDKSLLVSYKDHDGRNLDYTNLILTNRSALHTRSIQSNRARPNFLQLRVPVRQLTMDGKIIATYTSITEAEKKNRH